MSFEFTNDADFLGVMSCQSVHKLLDVCDKSKSDLVFRFLFVHHFVFRSLQTRLHLWWMDALALGRCNRPRQKSTQTLPRISNQLSFQRRLSFSGMKSLAPLSTEKSFSDKCSGLVCKSGFSLLICILECFLSSRIDRCRNERVVELVRYWTP